jgi:hypothetical protein
MHMGAAIMRYGDLILPAALSGVLATLLLVGAILVRSSGPAEKGDRFITVSKSGEARTGTTPENGGRALDIGVSDLRGSLP